MGVPLQGPPDCDHHSMGSPPASPSSCRPIQQHDLIFRQAWRHPETGCLSPSQCPPRTLSGVPCWTSRASFAEGNKWAFSLALGLDFLVKMLPDSEVEIREPREKSGLRAVRMGLQGGDTAVGILRVYLFCHYLLAWPSPGLENKIRE